MPDDASEPLPSPETDPPETDNLGDGVLAQKAAEGCREAAQTLILRHQASVRGFLVRLTGDPALADDIAQETFIRMLRHAGRFDDRYSMKTWLLTIARRILINHHRKQKRIKPDSGRPEQAAPREDAPDERTARKDRQDYLKRKLDEAFDHLGPIQRDVLLLFYQQQRSILEIAEMLAMPEGTIKSHLHRARAALKARLEADPDWSNDQMDE